MSKESNRNSLAHLKQQLELWEKDGYDVSELKTKWHKELYERKPSHNKPIVVSSFMVGLIIISIGLGIYYGTHKEGGQAIIASATPTHTSTPIPELIYNGSNEDWQEAIDWINGNTPYPHNVLLQFTSGSTSTFMTAQDEATASALMDKLGYKYIAIDHETAHSKYPIMLTWSGDNVSDYYEMLYREDDGTLRTYNDPGSRSAELHIFYPDYYQSMCARLYNFGTEAAVPNNSTFVILFTEKTDGNSEKYKVIADVANGGNAFPNYEEAQEFLNDHPKYIIVGLDPFTSPIPLEALTEYELIHSSPSTAAQRDSRTISYVEVFEYIDYVK